MDRAKACICLGVNSKKYLCTKKRWNHSHRSCNNSSFRKPNNFSISSPASVISLDSWPVTSARVAVRICDRLLISKV